MYFSIYRTHEAAEVIYSNRNLISGCLGPICAVRSTAVNLREIAWERIGVVLSVESDQLA